MIQLDIDIPEGYEATGEFRLPKTGEYRIGVRGNVVETGDADWHFMPSIIIRPKWQPPACFPKGARYFGHAVLGTPWYVERLDGTGPTLCCECLAGLFGVEFSPPPSDPYVVE